jgi:hypothetical protein
VALVDGDRASGEIELGASVDGVSRCGALAPRDARDVAVLALVDFGVVRFDAVFLAGDFLVAVFSVAVFSVAVFSVAVFSVAVFLVLVFLALAFLAALRRVLSVGWSSLIV